MKTILKTNKTTDGILVIYLKDDVDSESRLFSIEKLIEMKINTGDLLEHPEYYGVTDDGMTIERTDFCKPELHEKPGECK